MTTQNILELLDERIKFYQSKELYTQCIALNKFKIDILQKTIDESRRQNNNE